MHKKLEELNEFFHTKTTDFAITIKRHEGRFTSVDQEDFSQLIDQLRNHVYNKISEFFISRLSIKCSIYDTQVIKDKLGKVREYKRGLLEEDNSKLDNSEVREKPRKKITFA
ncbi:unnamed protein product [Sphagnum balticum]